MIAMGDQITDELAKLSQTKRMAVYILIITAVIFAIIAASRLVQPESFWNCCCLPSLVIVVVLFFVEENVAKVEKEKKKIEIITKLNNTLAEDEKTESAQKKKLTDSEVNDVKNKDELIKKLTAMGVYDHVRRLISKRGYHICADEIITLGKHIRKEGVEIGNEQLKQLIMNEVKMEENLSKKNVEDRIKQHRNEVDTRKLRLLESGASRYIKSIVKKQGRDISADDLLKLRELIQKKGIDIEVSQLKELIVDELSAQEHEIFISRMLSGRPKTLEDYLHIFIDIYGENYGEKLDDLYQLLDEQKIEFDKAALPSKISDIINDISLRQFEENLKSDNSEPMSITRVDLMSGHEFEEFLTVLFRNMGYSVELTKLSNDQGADLIVTKFGEKTIVQAKRYTHTVGNGAIQEVAAAIKHYKAHSGWVVTTNFFSKPAMKLAQTNNIRLIDRSELSKLMQKYL